MPRISVIVPVYNVEKYLRKCVDSILAQTFTDLELILVDDGSPDGSGAICDQYTQKDGRVRVMHKENGGVSSARNAGIEAARGEWLCFVDGDDYIDETYLADFRIDNGKADMYMQGYRKVKNENILSEYSFMGLESNEIEVILAYSETHYIINSPCFKLYKNVLIKENNLRFDQSISYGEDHLFSLLYVNLISSISYSKTVGYNYFVTDTESLTQRIIPYQQLVYYICETERLSKILLSKYKSDVLKSAIDVTYIDNVFRTIRYFFSAKSDYTGYCNLLGSLTLLNHKQGAVGFKRKRIISSLIYSPRIFTYVMFLILNKAKLL